MNHEGTNRAGVLDSMPITSGDLAKFEEMDPSLSKSHHPTSINRTRD
jgi:hypothetical protein